MVSGGIATVIQKAMELNPVSLVGFTVFIAIFAVVSAIWVYFAPKKDVQIKQLSQDEKEQNNIKSKESKLQFFQTIKKIFFIVLGYLIINSFINFASFKLGFFDGEFQYRYDTKSAIAITPKNKIDNFTHEGYFYSLYKYKGKYYLLKDQEIPIKNKTYLTTYTTIYMYVIYRKLHKLDNFKDILPNISPVVYKEVNWLEMIVKPLWFLPQDITKIYWSGDEIRKYQKKYKEYLIKQEKINLAKLQKQNKNFLKSATEQELANQIEKQYKQNAYMKDTRYAIKLFDEFNSRPKAKRKLVKGVDVYGYQFKLMNYLNLFKKKEQLNDIMLKKYNFGVVYSFLFPNMSHPLDIPKQQYSHIRLVDMKQEKEYILTPFTVAIKRIYNMYGGIVPKLHIELKDDKVIIYLSSNETIVLENIAKKDSAKIVKLLTNLIDSVRFIETQFYGANNDGNFNYTNSNYLEIYNNDICKLSYKYKNHNWYLQEKRLNGECGKYKDIQKYLSSEFSANLYDDLAQKKPVKYMYFKPKVNLIYSAIDIDKNRFNEKDDLIGLSKDKDVVFVYELKGYDEYKKYAQMPQYTKIRIKDKKASIFKAMSYLMVEKSNRKYYIYLIKEDVFGGKISNQIYYMKDKYFSTVN
jgi:hypothetical protein